MDEKIVAYFKDDKSALKSCKKFVSKARRTAFLKDLESDLSETFKDEGLYQEPFTDLERDVFEWAMTKCALAYRDYRMMVKGKKTKYDEAVFLTDKIIDEGVVYKHHPEAYECRNKILNDKGLGIFLELLLDTADRVTKLAEENQQYPNKYFNKNKLNKYISEMIPTTDDSSIHFVNPRVSPTGKAQSFTKEEYEEATDPVKQIEKFIADTGMEDGMLLTVVNESGEPFYYLTGVGVVDEFGKPLN